MKTIQKILPYTLTNNQVFYLKEAWIINWIWWEWSNIEELLFNVIKWAYWFDNEKAQELLDDIKLISYPHDIDFFFKNWFIKSNIKYAYRLFKLLYWEKLLNRIGIMIFTFFLLNRYWKKYY